MNCIHHLICHPHIICHLIHHVLLLCTENDKLIAHSSFINSSCAWLIMICHDKTLFLIININSVGPHFYKDICFTSIVTTSKEMISYYDNMWHDQGEWVTCRQYSILIFQYKSPVHLKCYMLIQTPSQSDIWLQRYEQFFKFKNNVKHKIFSPLLACNSSKSIFPTSDSFPLIMSHI